MTYIIAKPISVILDFALGEELGYILSKSKMKRLFEIYEKDKVLGAQEMRILSATLEMVEKNVS